MLANLVTHDLAGVAEVIAGSTASLVGPGLGEILRLVDRLFDRRVLGDPPNDLADLLISPSTCFGAEYVSDDESHE